MRALVERMPEVAATFHLDYFVKASERGEDPILRGAPHLVIGHAGGGGTTAQADCTIALYCLELAAYSRGLGACWAGVVHIAAAAHPPLTEMLRLPKGHKCLGAMMLGYPKHRFHRIPVKKEPLVVWR